MTSLYKGKKVAFLTQHGKEQWVSPILESTLGCHIKHTSSYNTDLLGTFSGEVERHTSQVNTARRKAQIGIDIIGAPIGIASEGAFMADPFSGLMPWNIEVIFWLDNDNTFEVIGIAQGAARNLSRPINQLADLHQFAVEAGFPMHQIMLKTSNTDTPKIYKGISDWEMLAQHFRNLQESSGTSCVIAENDLRAFCNPTRQRMIERATYDLLLKLQSLCPSCHAPGFWMTQHETGLPCQSCARPTQLARSHLWTCNVCRYLENRPTKARTAEPRHCDYCNP